MRTLHLPDWQSQLLISLHHGMQSPCDSRFVQQICVMSDIVDFRAGLLLGEATSCPALIEAINSIPKNLHTKDFLSSTLNKLRYLLSCFSACSLGIKLCPNLMISIVPTQFFSLLHSLNPSLNARKKLLLPSTRPKR